MVLKEWRSTEPFKSHMEKKMVDYSFPNVIDSGPVRDEIFSRSTIMNQQQPNFMKKKTFIFERNENSSSCQFDDNYLKQNFFS